jgi:SAM-dependent methyltransferase
MGKRRERDRPAALAWAEQLLSWALPQKILDQAPQPPWIPPLAMFEVRADDEFPDTPSSRRAREALPADGTVLDVGCGGGRASLALVPPAARLIGVDERPQMVAAFANIAAARGVAHEECQGTWPDVANQVPVADVVVCHHVIFNVPDLAPFAVALSAHARQRVVLELGQRHPQAYLSPLWLRFWGLARPEGPTAETALQVLREVGLPARLDLWTDPVPSRYFRLTPQEQVEFVRIRLCLTAERDVEIAETLQRLPPRFPRVTATVWWDV